MSHPDVNLVSFTGGTATGARVASMAAPLFKKLSLELGGMCARTCLCSHVCAHKCIQRCTRPSPYVHAPVCAHIHTHTHSSTHTPTPDHTGKNAALVFADCDWEATIKECVRSAFQNSGQICLCNSRFVVQDSIYERFVQDFVEQEKKV